MHVCIHHAFLLQEGERVCGRPEDMSGPTCGVEIIKSEELGDAAHTKVLRPFVR